MALGQIPPWLNIGPTDYLQAIQAGTQAGLEVSRQRMAAQEAAARRIAAQQEAQQRIWEFGETMRQRAAQQAVEQELEREKMAQTSRYQSGLLDWHNEQARLNAEKAAQQAENQAALMGLRGENLNLAQARLEETMRRNQEMERMRQEAADRRTYPTEYETITEKIPALEEATPAVPAKPFEKKSLWGIDWLWRDQPATPAMPAVPAHGEQTITRRIPLRASAAIVPQAGTLSSDEMTDEEYAAQFGVPSGESETVEQAPPVADRVVGKVYLTPKGEYKWTGTGWVKP